MSAPSFLGLQQAMSRYGVPWLMLQPFAELVWCFPCKYGTPHCANDEKFGEAA